MMQRLGLRLTAAGPSRAAVRASPTWTRVRHAHYRRELQYPIEEGMGEFLPPNALRTVAVEYQQGLLDRLNEQTKGTPQENKTVVQTIINTSGDQKQTLAFNYASMALNNSFFLEFLKPPPDSSTGRTTHESEVTTHFIATLKGAFNSVSGFKSQFSAMALGMAGSGHVWLVCDAQGNLGIVPTFSTGTLLVRSRRHLSPLPGNVLYEEVKPASKATAAALSTHPAPSPTSPASGSSAPLPPSGALPHVRALHVSARRAIDPLLSQQPASFQNVAAVESDALWDTSTNTTTPGSNLATLGETLYPIFCLSVHEHCWMAAGFGVWGKEEWLKRYWTVLDWGKVSDAYGRWADQRTSASSLR